MMTQIQIRSDDLEKMRDALTMAQNYLVARDISHQSLLLTDHIAYSPLTTMVSDALERADGLLKDYLLTQHDDVEVDESE